MRIWASLLFCLLPCVLYASDPLLELAERQPGSAALRDAIVARMNEQQLSNGSAFVGEGGDFLFALRAASTPVLYVDGLRRIELAKLPGADLWAASAKLTTGTSHRFEYEVGGKRVGGRNDVPAYLPECYEQPGVPKGKLSDKIVHTSKIYDGMQSDYWVYVPAQYRPSVPAALMVWQDGLNHVNRDGGFRTLNVVDNLIHQGRLPVMIQVFISPGLIGDRRMRSVEYDTMDDTYTRFLRDEILAEVERQYNIRKDSYSRGIGGASSGAICAFTAAWLHPELFSRVHSLIGSYTSIQWHPGEIDGGNVWPFKLRKQPKVNIRVWLQDGSEDLENAHGSWPLQNIQMANSLKREGYDYHLSWGGGTHNQAHGNAEMPRSLEWLWRGYSADRTEQAFEQDEAEKAKPFWRVVGLNRD